MPPACCSQPYGTRRVARTSLSCKNRCASCASLPVQQTSCEFYLLPCLVANLTAGRWGSFNPGRYEWSIVSSNAAFGAVHRCIDIAYQQCGFLQENIEALTCLAPLVSGSPAVHQPLLPIPTWADTPFFPTLVFFPYTVAHSQTHKPKLLLRSLVSGQACAAVVLALLPPGDVRAGPVARGSRLGNARGDVCGWRRRPAAKRGSGVCVAKGGRRACGGGGRCSGAVSTLNRVEVDSHDVQLPGMMAIVDAMGMITCQAKVHRKPAVTFFFVFTASPAMALLPTSELQSSTSCETY